MRWKGQTSGSGPRVELVLVAVIVLHPRTRGWWEKSVNSDGPVSA
jgi:hypothetical protein